MALRACLAQVEQHPFCFQHTGPNIDMINDSVYIYRYVNLSQKLRLSLGHLL